MQGIFKIKGVSFIKDDKNILYSPDIRHSESFYTEGSFNKKEENKEDIIKIDKAKLLVNLYDKIKIKSFLLSQEIIDAYMSPLICMKKEFESILEELEKKKPEIEDPKDPTPEIIDPKDPKPEIIDPKDPKPEIIDPDTSKPEIDIFDKEDDIYIDIKDPESEFDINIEEGYNSNFIEIYEDYLIKIDTILDRFVFEVLEVNSNNDVNFELGNVTSVEIKNHNLVHLSDYVIKSSIYLRQAIRLHRKIYDIDESIFHIKAPKVAKEQMLRYYKASYSEVNDEVDAKNNLLLKESRFIAERKYNDSTRDLYKYLNSQVILLRETLSNMSKQLVSMAKLSRENEGGK